MSHEFIDHVPEGERGKLVVLKPCPQLFSHSPEISKSGDDERIIGDKERTPKTNKQSN